MGKAREPRTPINEDIRADQVRLIGADGEQVGIVDRDQALAHARGRNLDLVLIAADAEPPVCKVMDYGKHIFEQKKVRKENLRKQKQTQVKEIKFRPGTDEGDYKIKMRKLTEFLEEGDKAKVTLRFRGREMLHQDLGMNLLERIKEDLGELSQVEAMPKMEGRQMIMVLAPKKRK